MGQTKDTKIDERTRVRLERAVREHGEASMCDLLGLSSGTLARAVAGVPMSRGTAALVEISVRRLLAGEVPE